MCLFAHSLAQALQGIRRIISCIVEVLLIVKPLKDSSGKVALFNWCVLKDMTTTCSIKIFLKIYCDKDESLSEMREMKQQMLLL